MGWSAKKEKKRRNPAREAWRKLDARGNKIAEASKHGFRSAKNWRSPKPNNRIRERGQEGLKEWQACQQREALLALEQPELPSEEMDQAHPWWAIIDDGALRPRSEPLVIMGLAAKGAPPPDWAALASAAQEQFVKGGSGIHRLMASVGEGRRRIEVRVQATPWKSRFAGIGKMEKAWEGSERAALWTIGVLLKMTGSGGTDGSKLRIIQKYNQNGGRFDARRAKKRQGERAPSAWTEKFGAAGQKIWEAGGAKAHLGRKPNRMREERARAIIDAMTGAGALRAQVCPDFQANNPEAFQSWSGFAEMEARRLDAIRAKWGIESAAGPAQRNARMRPRM